MMPTFVRFMRFATVICLCLLAGYTLAQDAALPLPLGEAVTGQLSGAGDRVTYRFEMPPEQDVVVAYSADRVVIHVYCVWLTPAAEEDHHCQESRGGGGGDLPVSGVFVIPAAEQVDTTQTIELTLSRPLDEAARYELAVYPVTAESLTLDTTLDIQYDGALLYHVYSLEADSTQPFTLEIEAADPDGSFLWVAHQPFLAEPLPDERLWFPEPVDSAVRAPDGDGIERLHLSALGADSFRVLVAASGDYSLHVVALDIQPLDKGITRAVTISYREPIEVIRLDVQPGAAATVYFRVTSGTGALAKVYSEGDPVGDGLALGESSITGSRFPLAGTIDWTAEADRPVYVVLQIPFEFTRSEVRAEVLWQQ